MQIDEYADGYVVVHNGQSYSYKGKTLNVIDQITEKVKELLFADRVNELQEIVNDPVVPITILKGYNLSELIRLTGRSYDECKSVMEFVQDFDKQVEALLKLNKQE